MIAFYLIKAYPNCISEFYVLWMHKACLPPFLRLRTWLQLTGLSQYLYV